MANLRDSTGGKKHTPKGKENDKGTKQATKGESKPKA